MGCQAAEVHYQAGAIVGSYPVGKLWRHHFRGVLTDGGKEDSPAIHHRQRAASTNVNFKELLAFLAQAARGQFSDRQTQVLGYWLGECFGI